MNDSNPEDQASTAGGPEQEPKGPSISELPPKGIPDLPEREESHFQSLARRMITWLAFLLVGILVGGLAVYWLANRPLRSQLDQTQQQLTQSQQQSAGLQTRVDQLNSLETKNQDLQSQLTQNQIVLNLLSAQVDVSNARLALSNKDLPTAQAALSHMDGTLKTLLNLAPADQQSAIKDMQNRLKLASGELSGNSFAADSDLTVLSKSLTDLAAKYPSTP